MNGEQEVTTEQIGEALTEMASRFDRELLALSKPDLMAQWYWRWDETRTFEANVYAFSDALELHKRRCRRWEEHHNGFTCVVERVRDEYAMPRVMEFAAEVRPRIAGEVSAP